MSDPSDTLRAALAGRYTLDRELGRGGMATVWLARDLRHDRPVALKVLHPELSAGLGPERFFREISTTARLDHPHILPLLDSGEAGAPDAPRPLLWYTMPYVEGETLRDRLRREGQLPVEQAIRIAAEVADALDCAHEHGIVHRDVKPENILLARGHARVADFGIARALEAAGGGDLTATGIAVGTPAYMSPEQASGGTLDTRSDVYALGCVLYEMLAGEPPFTGPTAQAILAKRVLEPVPHVRTLRDTVPLAVEQALTRALAKLPADRFPTAGAFAQRLLHADAGTEATTLVAEAPRAARRGTPSRRYLVAVLGGLAVAILVLGITRVVRRPPPSSTDPELLAIAPFDILDPKLLLWHEGLVDLLARNLDGAGPLRTVSPTAVVQHWKGRADRVSATALASRTGAGLAAFGSLVPAGRDSVRLSASVVNVATGEIVADVEARGSGEHVDLLADSLTVRLLDRLGQSHAIGGVRRIGLGTRSLPALRAFLRGEQHFRRTDWDSARVRYEEAITLDTAFALAYWRLGAVRGWQFNLGDSLSVVYNELAGALNHGLPPRESLLVACDSVTGSLDQFAVVDSASRARLDRLFRMTDQLRDRYPADPESWVALGEARYHFGYGRGVTAEMTLGAFDRAIELDSAYAPAYYHPVELAVTLDDRAAIRRYADGFLALDPARETAWTMRTIRYMFDPTTPTDAVERLLDTLPVSALDRLNVSLFLASDSGENSVRTYRQFARRTVTQDVWWRAPELRSGLLAASLAFRGHVRESSLVLARYPGLFAWGTYTGLALAGIVPQVTADSVFRAFLRDAPLDVGPADMRAAFPPPWWAARRDTSALKQYAARLRSMHGRDNGPDRYWYSAAEAYLALARADSADALRRFRGLPRATGQVWHERLTLARLLAAFGRDQEALAVLDDGFPYAFMSFDRVTWALEQARLAEKLGQREKARGWYGYVARVWVHADPELKNVVAEARDGLQRLTSEASR
jgi:serine/threonine-protein kinase